ERPGGLSITVPVNPTPRGALGAPVSDGCVGAGSATRSSNRVPGSGSPGCGLGGGAITLALSSLPRASCAGGALPGAGGVGAGVLTEEDASGAAGPGSGASLLST